MLERRNSARLPLAMKVSETNGDYQFTWDCHDLSEDSLFLVNKSCFSAQDHHSKLSFTLPGGERLHNITARIVRETRKGHPHGCAYELLNLSEDQRMALKRFFHAKAS